MISAVVYGMNEAGSPFDSRNRKFDAQRVSDISTLTYSIENYYSTNKKLPATLDDLSKTNYANLQIKDPETSIAYEYKALTKESYQLCATFSTDNMTNAGSNRPQVDPYSYSDPKYQHPKGKHCFELNAVTRDLNQSVQTVPSVKPTATTTLTNDNESAKSQRDSTRLADLGSIQSAIGIAVQDAPTSGPVLLCNATAAPCLGRSIDAQSDKTDGNGWAKIDISHNPNLHIKQLPLDPLNNGIYHYTYCSDGNNYEIDVVLESNQQASKMQNDGGDDPAKYEAGTSLTLIGTNGKCTY